MRGRNPLQNSVDSRCKFRSFYDTIDIVKPGDLIHGPRYSHVPRVRLIIREYVPFEGQYMGKACYDMLDSEMNFVTWPAANTEYHWSVVE